MLNETGKPTTIRRVVVRKKTNVSLHHRDPIEGPSEIPRTLAGLKGAFSWSPSMQKDSILSDNGRNFFQSVYYRTRLKKITLAVRETSVSRHHRGRIKGLLNLSIP